LPVFVLGAKDGVKEKPVKQEKKKPAKPKKPKPQPENTQSATTTATPKGECFYMTVYLKCLGVKVH